MNQSELEILQSVVILLIMKRMNMRQWVVSALSVDAPAVGDKRHCLVDYPMSGPVAAVKQSRGKALRAAPVGQVQFYRVPTGRWLESLQL